MNRGAKLPIDTGMVREKANLFVFPILESLFLEEDFHAGKHPCV
jgi:hypothetical protein